MDFFINNLAVLLTTVAIVATIGTLWACHTIKRNKLKPMAEFPYGTRTGRISCKRPNYEEVDRPMATYRK